MKFLTFQEPNGNIVAAIAVGAEFSNNDYLSLADLAEYYCQQIRVFETKNDVVHTLASAERFLRELNGETPKPIMARFFPQAWINDYATTIDGSYEFDVTDQVLALGREKALQIRDDKVESDHLWIENPVSTERPHTGPFVVEVEAAIRKYFEQYELES